MTSSITTIAKGDGSGIVRPRRTVARSAGEWQALWAAHAGPAVAAPQIDFSREMVAAAFGGERPTPGYAIEIADARLEGDALVIPISEQPPVRGGVAAQVIVSPFHMVRMPRHDGEVRFVDAATSTAGGATPAPARQPGNGAHTLSANPPSSTGLDPKLAAALAYLSGPFSGIIILLVERANDYVRFHAWQSIIGLGGLALLAVAMLLFSFATLLISPLVFTVMYRFSAVLAILWVVVWGVCLVKAFTGSRWEMPVVGRYAAKLTKSTKATEFTTKQRS
jgi:uncharacterized membrane protein